MRIPVDYPTPTEERQIVHRFEDVAPTASRLLDPEDVIALQAAARAIEMDEATTDYAVRLVLATRDPARYGVPEIVGQLEYGASPRASLGLVRAAKALALLRGRDRATPQDVYDIAYDVLNLRLVLSYTALADGLTVDDVLVRLLKTVPAPTLAGAWQSMAVPAAAAPAMAPAMTATMETAPTMTAPLMAPGAMGAPAPLAATAWAAPSQPRTEFGQLPGGASPAFPAAP